MKQVLIGIALMFTSAFAMALLPNSDPAVVCSYLADEQLGTHGWQVDEEQRGRCVSGVRGFGREAVGPLHQLSYEVSGDETSATILQVVFDVNPPQAMTDGSKAFAQASQRLSTEAFGKRLPSTISGAIAGSREATAKVGDATLSVTRREHESGQGYQMRFTIQ